MKELIGKLAFIKINNFPAKVTVKRTRRQATDWEKIFAKDTSDICLLPNISTELLKFNNKKMKNSI